MAPAIPHMLGLLPTQRVCGNPGTSKRVEGGTFRVPARPAGSRAREYVARMHAGASRSKTRVRFGELWVDSVTMAEALDEIETLVVGGRGGSVFTPNVDHVVNVEKNPSFRVAYAGASLSLADGQPLVWTSRLLGAPLPEKVSGSDLLLPLIERAAARRWKVYLLGGGAGVAEKAAKVLTTRFSVDIVGCDAPLISLESDPAQDELVIDRIHRARPEILIVAFGAPKQELWLHRAGPRLRPTVGIGLGAALDFVAGARRAPAWMSRAGLEWLFRLAREPRRLSRRYLLD